MFRKIVVRNGFGHEIKETTAVVTVTIHDRRKAVYLFNEINNDVRMDYSQDGPVTKVFR